MSGERNAANISLKMSQWAEKFRREYWRFLALLRSDVRGFGRIEEIVLVLERLGRFCMNICGDLLAWLIAYILVGLELLGRNP